MSELGASRVTLPGHAVSTVEGLDATSRAALLLAALAGRCEQWGLVEATTMVVQGPIDVNVLDPLVALGLAVVDQGWVHVPRDDVRRAVTSRALPSQLQQAHLALAGLASTDALRATFTTGEKPRSIDGGLLGIRHAA